MRQKQLEVKWEQKPLHGQYVLQSKYADVDQKNTDQWLRSSGLKSETERFLLAVQIKVCIHETFKLIP